MDNTIDDLHDQFSCSTIADVEKLQAQFEVFKSGELQNASAQYTEVANLVTEMAALGSTDNPYTALTAEVMVADEGSNMLCFMLLFFPVHLREVVQYFGSGA